MKQRYVFSPSTLHFDDLAYFNGELLGMNNIVVASGEVSSTVNATGGASVEIYLGEKSVIKGEFKPKDYPVSGRRILISRSGIVELLLRNWKVFTCLGWKVIM